jgi:hypothetical protein
MEVDGYTLHARGNEVEVYDEIFQRSVCIVELSGKVSYYYDDRFVSKKVVQQCKDLLTLNNI